MTPGAGARAGLCDRCRHQQLVPTSRSVFSLCLLSRENPRYPRYPSLPVRSCPGFEPAESAGNQPVPGT